MFFSPLDLEKNPFVQFNSAKKKTQDCNHGWVSLPSSQFNFNMIRVTVENLLYIYFLAHIDRNSIHCCS